MAAIPLFVTDEMRDRLHAKGFSDADIDMMRPAEAWRHLGGMPEPNPMRQKVRQYLEWGFSVIPLRANDKRPVRPWEELQRRMVTEAEIQHWEWPNIGIITGAISGIIVLDVDSVEGEKELKKRGMPPTPMVATAKGRHIYLKHPGGEVRNFARRLPGMDLRGDGGYVVAPPSMHPSGVRYEWVISPADCDVADAPQWLLDLIAESNQLMEHVDHVGRLPQQEKVSYAQAALASEISALLRTAPGKRNHQLNRAAFTLGQLVAANELNRVDVERQLYDSAVSIGLDSDPDCGIEGIWNTIRSGLTKGMQKPRVIKPQQTPATIPGFLLMEDADDEGNAQCVRQIYGNMFLHCEAMGWLQWRGTHWESTEAEASVERRITEVLKARRLEAVKYDREKIIKAATPNRHRIIGCKAQFSSLVSEAVDAFDASPDLLNCRNGVVDLRSGRLIEHSAGQRFTYCLPVEYDPAADWTQWEEFLHGVVGGGPEMVDYLQMAVGYSLTGLTSEECLFYVHGPTRSGKGTFTETLLELLPKPLGIETDFNTFTQKREDSNNFDLAPLKPARFVVASESNKYQSLNSGKIKQLTGGNEVYCAFKHRTHFAYRPQYKVWLVSNHPVNADVDDDAAWYRLRVIEFPNSFAGHEDKNLKTRMKEQESLRAVLAWAVVGAVKWYASPTGLITPARVEDVTRRQRADLDYVQAWLDECCVFDPTRSHWVANDALYLSYKEWCRENGVEPKQMRGVSLSLRAKGFDTGVQRKSPMGKNQKGVTGLRMI